MTQTDINSAIAERAIGGEWLTEAELVELDGVDVLAAGMLADEARRVRSGATVSYTRVLEITGSVPAVGDELARDLERAGEVRLTVLPETAAAAAELVRAVRALAGAAMRLTGFSLGSVAARGWTSGGALAEWRSAGLDAIAEAPIDQIAASDVHAVLSAGLAIDALSLQRPFEEGRVAQVLRARAIAADLPAATALAPLPHEQPVRAPTTGYHDVRMVALARLGLPTAGLIQVDWQRHGPKLAQVALTFGANHLDRVSLRDDPELGRRRSSVEDVRRNIVAAGFEPVERRGSR